MSNADNCVRCNTVHMLKAGRNTCLQYIILVLFVLVVIDPHLEFKGMPPMTSLCSDSTLAEFIMSLQNI